MLGDLKSANIQDSSDCVKRLLCELQGKIGDAGLDWDERLIYDYISPSLNYDSPIIQFQLAADLGSRNPEQCRVVYSR